MGCATSKTFIPADVGFISKDEIIANLRRALDESERELAAIKLNALPRPFGGPGKIEKTQS